MASIYLLFGRITIERGELPTHGSRVKPIKAENEIALVIPAVQKPINVSDVQITEYKGQRVVTFAQVDEVHGRPEGTARRTFLENRERLVEGEEYHLITQSQKDEFRSLGVTIPNRGLTVLTEDGYLMLVKSFTDELAWQIQKKLVKSYFRPAQNSTLNLNDPASLRAALLGYSEQVIELKQEVVV